MENEEVLNVINHEVTQEQVNLDTSHDMNNVMINMPDKRFRIIYRKSFRDYLLDFLFFCLRIIFIIAVIGLIVYVIDLYSQYLVNEFFSSLGGSMGA